MKIKKIINRLDYVKRSSRDSDKLIKRGDPVSLMFCDVTSGVIKVRTIKGSCLRLRRSGLSSSLKMTGAIKSTLFTQIVPLHSPQVVDLSKA